MDEKKRAHVELTLPSLSYGATVKIDGHDITNSTSRVIVTARVGEATEVGLVIVPENVSVDATAVLREYFAENDGRPEDYMRLAGATAPSKSFWNSDPVEITEEWIEKVCHFVRQSLKSEMERGSFMALDVKKELRNGFPEEGWRTVETTGEGTITLQTGPAPQIASGHGG